jgi:hypothetical protein
MRLSQGQLNLLAACPRKFQHIYLEQLGSPITPEQQERLNWGNRFHLLMQQREMELPIAPLNEADQPLQHCAEALIAAAPELFRTDQAKRRQSEHRRTLEFAGYLLTVIYDLVILDDHQAHICDWKTYPRPPKTEALQQNWQTRLYRFVLAETSDYLPEQIAMTYWFIRAGEGQAPNPQSLTFNYSQDQWERDRHDLTQLLHQLQEWLHRYEAGEPFPQVNETSKLCQPCHFVERCQRDTGSPNEAIANLINLADIQEIAL